MNWFIGTTGYSFFDWWSLVHLSFWIFVGSTFWAFRTKVPKGLSYLICITVAYAWEVFEHFMAPRYPNIWLDPESWWNAWISDPLMCTVGFLGIWWALDHRKRRP